MSIVLAYNDHMGYTFWPTRKIERWQMTNDPLALAQQRLLAHRRELKTEKQPRPIGDIQVIPEEYDTQDYPNRTTPNSPRPFQDAPDDKPARVMERVWIGDLDTSDKRVKHAVDMCFAWAKRKREHKQLDASIIFVGPPGVGKTHCARALWWSICDFVADLDENGDPVWVQPAGRFFMSNDLITELGQVVDPVTGLATQARAATIIGTAPLIVIDDVGAEQTIPFVAAVDQLTELHNRFFKVIDYCYNAKISVIITSNLTFPDLATRLGKRSFSRLAAMAPRTEAGSFMVDLFGVEDYRMKESGR